jgi:hypothetical protein
MLVIKLPGPGGSPEACGAAISKERTKLFMGYILKIGILIDCCSEKS